MASSNAAAASSSLDDELGVPKEATLNPATIEVRLESATTGGGVSIPLSAATCNRRDGGGRSWLVGRQAATADLRIQHKSISRRHAVLYVVGNRVYLKDFGGKHGTTVNDRKLEGSGDGGDGGDPSSVVELKSGDSILFGNVRESVFRVKIRALERTENNEEPQSTEEITTTTTISKEEEDHRLIEKAGEGLTGRAKRQAEIAAMMESLNQAPAYHKHDVVAPPAPEDESGAREEGAAAAADEAATKPDSAVQQVIDRHNLPISDRFKIPSESERRNAATCVAIDPPGSRFVAGSSDTRLRFYDFGGMDRNRTASFKELIPDDGYLLVGCAFSNTGDRILVGTSSVQPRVLDREGDEIIKFVGGDRYVTDQARTVGHTAAVTAVDWHPLERDIVLTSSNDGSARLWNLNGKTQFQMLVCDKVFQAKSERGQRTAVKCVCFHPGGREFALGTACGSIQIWNRARVSGRPERAVYGAHGDGGNKPVTSLTYSTDGTKLASRSAEDDDTVRVWNAQRMSRSSAPLAVCLGLETVHENANACFSPKGKVVCAGSSVYQKKNGTEGRTESGSLNFYDVDNSASRTTDTAVAEPILSYALDGNSTPVITKWHAALNQIFVGCSDGGILVFYDPKRSTKGALLPVAKIGRSVDGLSELLRSRASQGSSAISGEIVTPFSLPMYREIKISEKKRKRHERKDPVLSKEPERPTTGKHKTGGQTGSSLNFAQFVADQTTVKTKAIAGKDPREALFQYNEGDKTNTDRKLAEKTAEEEAEELDTKKS